MSTFNYLPPKAWLRSCGATTCEYALIIVLLMLIVIVPVRSMGKSLKKPFICLVLYTGGGTEGTINDSMRKECKKMLFNGPGQ